MTLVVFYRAVPSRGSKPRPEYFSKSACLASFLGSADAARFTDIHLHFLCDGVMPTAVDDLMRSRGVVTSLGGIGNSLSYRQTLELAMRTAAPDDICYFVEDDYLHVADGVDRLARGVSDAPAASYLTLYDHPDRYGRRRDLRVPGSTLRLYGGGHWRTAESTTMTFACTGRTLRADIRLLRAAAGSWFSYPHDNLMWRSLQGLGRYRPMRLRRGPARRLLSAVPGGATHVEPNVLSPCIDWPAVAGTSADLARRLGMDTDSW